METGAPTYVATLIQIAAASSADSMRRTKLPASRISAGSMISLDMVPITSPPAISAPMVSNTAAMANAPAMVSAPEPTAGPTLLATSLAPMLSAM